MENNRQSFLGAARRVMRGNMKVAFDFDKFALKNIFNKISSDSDYGFYYWPYGYLYRHCRWGTVNDLGYRDSSDFPDIPIDHERFVYVGIFGGSTGYDVLVPDHEAFYSMLEVDLNKRASSSGLEKRFRVINFSQPGNMLLNQIFNFVLHGERFKLDFVICHNAVNDFATLQMNDQNLVERHMIGYCDVLEAWGCAVHERAEPTVEYFRSDISEPGFKPASCKNGADAILKATFFRINQFSRLARVSGAIFINGFQPWITSKKQLSDFEKDRLENYNPYYQEIYKNVPFLYEQYEKYWLKEIDADFSINFHKIFSNLPGNVNHFGDVCHLLGPGNEVIAKHYADSVWEATIASV